MRLYPQQPYVILLYEKAPPRDLLILMRAEWLGRLPGGRGDPEGDEHSGEATRAMAASKAACCAATKCFARLGSISFENRGRMTEGELAPNARQGERGFRSVRRLNSKLHLSAPDPGDGNRSEPEKEERE